MALKIVDPAVISKTERLAEIAGPSNAERVNDFDTAAVFTGCILCLHGQNLISRLKIAIAIR